ncbi:hypothetical protein EYC80_009013 [Monilinia laxa]|uniref:Uncharacterized protein n=1 Tax=Monilinia laxa TaxID=61186 RepID=A0A5N6K248_MONLA|nr:hypothetical protein EYC80_009013 [Monilinia laxa]
MGSYLSHCGCLMQCCSDESKHDDVIMNGNDDISFLRTLFDIKSGWEALLFITSDDLGRRRTILNRKTKD